MMLKEWKELSCEWKARTSPQNVFFDRDLGSGMLLLYPCMKPQSCNCSDAPPSRPVV